MNIATRYVSRDYLRNGKLNIQGGSISNSGSSSYGGGLTGNYLPAISNGDGTYTVDLTNVTFNGNIVATGEVSAYGTGESSGTTGTVTVYDGLDSTAIDVALSANLGRVLKEMITNLDIGDIDLSGYYSKEDIDNLIKGYSKTDHTHTIANITDLQAKLDTYALKSELTTHTGNTTIHITADERTKWNGAATNSHTHTNKKVLDEITSAKITSWDSTNTNFNDWFYKDSSGYIHSKYTFIGDSEISAFGAGSSSGSGGSVTVYDGLDSTETDVALSANQGRILKGMIENIDLDNITVDLSEYYKKTEVDSKLSGKSNTNHTHTNYLSNTGGDITGTLVIKRDAAAIKYMNAAGDAVRGWIGFNENNDATIWASDGVTTYTILHSNNYSSYSPTLSAFNTHTSNTTVHITAAERTKWNTASTNSHTHSNKTVLDGITSTKVSNWDTVYSNWNKVFTIDSNGDLKVKVNVIGEKEISAYGAGTTSGGGSITIVDALTSTSTDAALSANQGRVLKNMIDNIDVGDLSNYYSKSEIDTKLTAKLSTSGGTITSTTATPLILNSTASRLPYIQFNNSSTVGGFVGGNNSGSMIIQTGTANDSEYSVFRVNRDGSAEISTNGTYYDVITEKNINTYTSKFYSNDITRTANTVLAAPNGSNGTASFRKLVAADLPSHTHSYLPLSNTAQVYVNSTQTGVVNFKSTSGSEVGVRMYLGDTNLGGLWANANDGIYLYRNENGGDKLGIRGGAPYFYDDSANGGTYYTLLHRGNLSTGAFGNNKLDTMVQYTIDTTALSTSNYYPIVFAASPKMLRVSMYSQTGSSSAAYNCNTLDFSFRGMGWTDVPQGLTVHHYNTYTETEKTIGCIGMGQEGGMKVVWVRGGLTYYIASNITPVLCSTNYTNGNEIFTVGTNQYGGTNTKVTVLWTPQSTSGRGTLYHNAGLALGGGFSLSGAATLKSSLAVTGTSTFTGAATFNGGLTSTTVTTRNVRLGDTFQATISSAGWYRFATSHSADNAGGTYIFFIKRNYYNSDNEAYIISCTVDDNKVHWCQLNGSANARLISQVRATWTNNSTMYFDFYYSGTVANTVTVNCVGNATCQVPAITTSALGNVKEFVLTDGIKLGTTSAYPITVFRDNSAGGAYIQYGAVGQLTKTWAAGSDSSHNFSWYYKDTSAGTDVAKMWLTSDSKLNFAAGVGSRKLVINGNSAAFQFYSTTGTASWAMGNFFYNNSGSAIGQMGAYGAGGTLSYYYVGSAYDNANAIKFYNTGNMGSAYWTLNNTTTNPYLKLVHTYNSTTYTHYLQGYQGYLALGTTSTKSLKIDSNGNCVAAGEVTAHSDKRLKSNIKPLEVRGELNPVTYTKDGKESIGFIADEVKELYPELVSTDESTDEKYLSLNYAQLTAVLYAEIKELKKEINELKNRI